MAIRNNAFYGAGYNNEAIGGIAQMFGQMMAPPSASEANAYSAAALNRQKHAQIEDLYAQGATPSERAALVDIQDFGQTPQGFTYQVDQNNATLRANNLLDNQTKFLDAAYGPEGGSAIPAGMAAPLGYAGPIEARPYTKPLSETEVKGQWLQDMKPGLTEQQIYDLASDGGKTDTIQNLEWRAEQAGLKPGTPEYQQFMASGGSGGTSLSVGPDGSVSFSQGNVRTTEANDRAGYAYQMVEPATQEILSAFDTGALPSANDYRLMSVINNPMSGIVRPELIQQVSPEGQAFYQNVRTALPMQLMTQSGQAVTEQEYDRKMMELMPIAGEDPEVTADKRRQFEIYLEAVQTIAGPAMKNIETTAPQEGLPAGVTEEDIQHTMQVHGLTREEVLERIR